MTHNDMFPAVFRTTTIGVCNIAGRTCTMFMPLIAEVPEPFPQWTLFTVSAIALVMSFNLEKKTDKFY